MKVYTAAEIADERASFHLMGADRFVRAEVAEELRALLALAEVAIRTKHQPPSDWRIRTESVI